MRKSIFILIIIGLTTACNKKNITSKFKGNWKFYHSKNDTWFQANVPGNIHLDLERNNIIGNPFYGTNEEKIQWIEKKDWSYEGSFTVNNDLLDFNNIEIEFTGLDTYSDIFLNGEKILSTENMFISYKKEVSKLLIKGENKLKVVFHSPIKKTKPLHQKSKYTYPADNDRSEEHLSVYTRKAPYHYGWDWGPRFVTSGIWKPIYIHAWDDVRIKDVYLQQNEVLDSVANFNTQIEIQNNDLQNVELEILVNDSTIKTENIELVKGTNSITSSFNIEKPKLWWPNGMGEPTLYNIKTILKKGNTIVDTKEQNIGIRTIEVVNTKDSIGESFYLKVNGKPLFIKGANYIPNDSFLGRVTDSVYERNFEDAVASNMNMLRVWGGGIYENDKFYELANENGILIWQDFMFSCTMYPSDDAFLKNVKNEAIYNIKRLRNHPSIALWCGNNEVMVGWNNWGWQSKYQYSEEDQKELLEGYKKLFHQLLPDLINQYDSDKFYLPSSPISNWGNKEDFTIGDNHYWGVWWGKHPFENFNEYVPRFMSEFGFQSFPSMKTINKFSESIDWDIDSEVMKGHQKSSIGNITIKEYMQRDYKKPKNFEGFVYLSQVMQAEGMRIGFEAHRRNKPFNMGTLYWQFNDVWPVVSWSGIDYFGEWKAMQYFIKKSFEPIISSAVINNQKLNIHLISDLPMDKEVETTIEIKNFNGDVIWKNQQSLRLKENSNLKFIEVEYLEVIGKHKSEEVFLVITNQYDDKSLESTFIFSKPKDLLLQKPNYSLKTEKTSSGYRLHVSSDTFVKNLQLSTIYDGKWSDNFFDMVPNKTYSIDFKTSLKIPNFINHLELTSLKDTY